MALWQAIPPSIPSHDFLLPSFPEPSSPAHTPHPSAIYAFPSPSHLSSPTPNCATRRRHTQVERERGRGADKIQGEIKESKRRPRGWELARRRDGNGAAPPQLRRRHGRLPLLLPLVLPGRPPAAARERGGAEAEPCGDDGGAGGGQGGAEEEGAEHRQARRPRRPGDQGARPAAAPPPRRVQAAAGHVQRHRLRLQPRLLPRRPLLRPRHLLRQPLQARQPSPRRRRQAERRRLPRRRRARHARQEEAAAAEGEAAAVGHGGGAPAAEPPRRRPAPAVAQPAAGAQARHAPRRRPRRRLRRRSAGRRRLHRHRRAGLRRRRRLHEEADGGGVHTGDGHGGYQLLAGLRHQAAQATLILGDSEVMSRRPCVPRQRGGWLLAGRWRAFVTDCCAAAAQPSVTREQQRSAQLSESEVNSHLFRRHGSSR